MSIDLTLFAYIGPETILPATSALAAVGGVLMLFSRQLRRLCSWCWHLVSRR